VAESSRDGVPGPANSRGLRHGLAWSGLNNLALRLGSLALGIVLARLLSPEQFGVYAVALTVQAALMTLADLGLSADLIRSENPRLIAPTVATLGLVAGCVMTLVMASSGPTIAALMGSPGAGDVIVVLAFTLILGGAGVVPYAMLMRRFEQKKLFAISVVDFSISTTLTLVLLTGGWGVLALAVGRLVAQSVVLILQFVVAREQPRFGLDRKVVRPVLAFGLPIAAANLLSWTLLNADNVVISSLAGPAALGFYVLAFNISSWPMSALGQVVRSVALPAFSRDKATDGSGLKMATALTWAAALPAGAFLALLSVPLITVVYGDMWLAAAPVLAALGIFGALRAVFDVWVAYLLAHGAARTVFCIQLVWFVALVPATIYGTIWWGIEGAAVAHVVVGLVIILPAYGLALHRTGASVRVLLRSSWQPLAAMVPAGALAFILASQLANPVLALLIGGLAGGGVYAALMYRWVVAQIPPEAESSAPENQLKGTETRNA
jgi:O-antigen/teichoic acid export membrane protein